MVELQMTPGFAPVPGRADICALPAVALPNGTLHVRRDVPWIARTTAVTRPRDCREPLLPQLCEMILHRPAHDLAQVRRRGIHRQLLDFLHVGVHLSIEHELHEVAVTGARCDARSLAG